MLYYLFTFLDRMDIPGAGVFQYISFRSAMGVITSLFISLMYGKKIIYYLQRKQIGETIRDLGLEGQMAKKGTPTMGGVIILTSVLIPVLLFCDLKNIYIQLMLLTTVWLGLVGFLDDYIKVFRKNKEGLQGKVKLLGQISLAIIIGATLWLNNDVVVREKVLDQNGKVVTEKLLNPKTGIVETRSIMRDVKSTKTTIPFFKGNELDYSDLLWFLGDKAQKYGWIVLILVIIVVVTAVSNGANITDGLDGLATGTSAIQATTLGVLAYLSGNLIYSEYLNIMYLPNSGELVIFISTVIGATIGFLWYNSYPAQIFMGDTGSLALGGIIAVAAIIIRKELLIPILSGIFLIENVSVMVQVSYFKYTKKKFGEGRRVFKMAPLHHHYQMKNYPEPKIVTRFWIVGILLAVITIVTLKIR